MGTKRKISILCSILIVTSPVIAAFLALVLLLHSSLQAHANTWGNVDQLESGEVSGSAQGCFSSPIWGSTTYCVSQRYKENAETRPVAHSGQSRSRFRDALSFGGILCL